MPPDLIERRISLVATIGAVVVFLLFALLAPAGFPSFDEWKYFGIGYNIWAGRGLTTVFGREFLLHGPIWSAVVTLPHVLFGADSAAWGRILNGLSGATIVGLSAWFGWRIRPAAGAFAAIAMVGMLYLHDQSRTARLDVPAAAFALLYVAVGHRGAPAQLGALGGCRGGRLRARLPDQGDRPPVPPDPVLRVGPVGPVVGRDRADHGVDRADRVDRHGAMVRAVRVRDRARLSRRDAGLDADTRRPRDRRARRHRPDRRPNRRGRPVSRVVRSERVVRREWTIRLIVGLGGALAWAAAQLYAYSKTARLKGGPILTPQQLDLYADTWIKPYWFAVLPAAIGLALSLVALAAYWRRPQRRPMVDLIIAGICGAPLVIFVVGVGEPPRNYLAQLALVAPLVAIGWIWAVEWFLGERRAWITVPLATAAGLVAGAFIGWRLRIDAAALVAIAGGLTGFVLGWVPTLGPRVARDGWSYSRPVTVATVLVLSLGVASAALGLHTLRARPTASGPARDAAITTVDAWVRENIPAGSRLAFGSFLGYEMALTLSDDYTVSHARHGNVSSSVTAPDGIKRTGELPIGRLAVGRHGAAQRQRVPGVPRRLARP